MNPPEAALAYAARGWAVFPCERRSKRPLGRLAPHGLKEASTNPERIRAWWATDPAPNVGIATGLVSGLFVVDLDGAAGEDAYGLLLARHGPLCEGDQPDGATVRTPGGGWHLYVALPLGVQVSNSAGRIAPGIDVRGEGGYVVAPPSLHPEGGAYFWRDPPGLGLPNPRAWVLDLTARSTEPWSTAAPPASPFDGEGTAYGLAALREELARVSQALEGTRNETLNRAAFAIGSLAAARHVALESAARALGSTGVAVGLSPAEVKATLISGLRAGLNSPRTETAS